MDLLDVLGSARAMRWFAPGDLPEATVEKLIWAATRASSSHNSQPWDFVVVREAEVRTRIGAAIAASVRDKDPMPPVTNKEEALIDAGVRNLFEHIAEVPVLVFVCARNNYPESNPDPRFMWSAISNAAQNLLVAARALGVGAGYTMLHTLAESEIRATLGIPEDRTIGVMMPLGIPGRPFGPVSRKPLEEVVHRDHW